MVALLHASDNSKEMLSRTQIVPDKIYVFRERGLHGTGGKAEFKAAVRSTRDTMLQTRHFAEPKR